MSEAITIKVMLSEGEALAVSQLLKRMGHDDYHQKANHYNQTELGNMIAGASNLQRALARAGFDPR